MPRDKSSRHIGAYVAPEKHAAFEAVVKAKGLNIQSAMEFAIDAFLANAGVFVPVVAKDKPPRRGSVPEMLQLLLEGQRNIQDGVSKVLGEITRLSASQQPIAPEGPVDAQLGNGQIGEREVLEALRRASDLIKAHGRNPKLPHPVKKDRPGKQSGAAGSHPRRGSG